MSNKRESNFAMLGVLSLFAILAALAVLSIYAVSVNAGTLTSNVVANVIVSNTCFTSITPALPSFAAITPPGSDNTNLAITDTDNGGNQQATINIAGTGGSGGTIGYWTGPGTNTIPVGNTLWDSASQGSYTGTALTNALASTSITVATPNTVNPSTNTLVYLGLGIPAGQPAGAYSQQIEFQNSCGTGSTTQTVTANVVVQGVCYISLFPSGISFGTLTPTATYNTNVIVSDNDVGGNTAANVLIEATSGSGATLGYWIGPGSNTIPVGNTLYNGGSLGSYAGNALTNSLVVTAINVPAPNIVVTTTTANVFFGLGVPGGTAGGTYTQNILIENSC